MAMPYAPQRPSKTASEVRNVAVSFVGKLDSGELLTGSPTVAESTGDLAIANVAVSTAALTINGASVAAGAAVQFSVSGGTAGTTYVITIACGTDSTPAQTLRGAIYLPVVADS